MKNILYAEFEKLFGASEVEFFSAPGRTEVGGNHTDHQQGRALAGSINLDVVGVASRSSDFVTVKSKGHNLIKISLCDLEPCEEQKNTSASLVRGVLHYLSLNGYNIGGFNAYTESRVLRGSGLSSSAAFETIVATIISYLYNDGKIDPVTIAKAGQYAENVHFGKPSGLLDQIACSVGGFTFVDFLDKENPKIEKIDFDLSKFGYNLCIINTHGSHSKLTDEYAQITEDMAKIANHFGKNCLRQVDEEEFAKNIPTLRRLYGDRALLRSMHFFEEDRRAVEQAEALKRNDFERFLSLVKQSGRSSFMKLQNIYSLKNTNQQPLSLALALAEQILGDNGACRVHGGGFAGTIQAYVPNQMLETFKERMEKVFGENSCYVLNIRPLGGIRI